MMNNNHKQQGCQMMKLRRSSLFSFFTAARRKGRARCSQAQTLPIVAILFALTGAPAIAGNYELVKGGGVEVCEAYLENLNSFDNYMPMNCSRDVNPKLKMLSKPAWQNIDAVKNFELLQAVDKFLSPLTHMHVTPEYINLLKSGARGGGIFMFQTEIDIDNDGNPETVLKYEWGPCTPEGKAIDWGTPIVVLDKPMTAVQAEKTLPLLQNMTGDRAKYPTGGWKLSMYDVFRYNGMTYFDKWSDLVAEGNRLHVYVIEKSQTTEICTYRFLNSNNARKVHS